jgi:hypothetical protein
MIFVADIPFTGLWQRPQELAVRLGADYYIYPGKFRFGLMGRVGNMKLIAVPQWHFNSRYPIVNTLCLMLSPWLDWLMKLIQGWIVDRHCPKESEWFIQSVQLSTLSQRFGADKVHFDYIDLYSFGRKVPKWFTHRFQNIVQSATTITHTHPNLRARLDSLLVPNACDAEKMQRKFEVYGYFGAIADYIDFDWILDLLSKDENYCCVMVGKVTTDIPEHPRLLVLPQIPHALLPVVAKMFTYAIVPFKKLALTESVDSVKVHEYYALGLPIISTLPQFADGKTWDDRVDQIMNQFEFGGVNRLLDAR